MFRPLQTAAAVLLAVAALFGMTRPAVAADVPLWPTNSVIYTLYPSIFSPKGNFAGITAQLGRLKTLGVTDVWVMPVTPIGHTIPGHGAFDSPYCVHDYFAVNPSYGTDADLQTLVTVAHKKGLRVILDEVLNHTSWDNALITQHPEYYVHSDGNPQNPASIQQAFNFSDVAQLNYANTDLRAYMITMLKFWITKYHVDGFRFDTADDPDGPGRKIPADFWQQMGMQLRQAKPDVLLLEEGQTPDLAMKPFALDYGWHMYDALKNASNDGSATLVQDAWNYQKDSYPPGMKHLSIQDDWDDTRDVNTLGGLAGAMAAAVFNFTNVGVPLIYNGMEIGNAAGVTNPHAAIDWQGGDPRFPGFYHALVALRQKNPALQQGAMTWLSNSAPSQVLSYTRTGGGAEFLMEINLSSTAAQGTVTLPAGPGWTPVSLTNIKGKAVRAVPARFSLRPKEFAIFKRRAALSSNP